MSVMVEVYFDGACIPVNPGGTGTWGIVGYVDGVRRHEACGVCGSGERMSNNVAEYEGVIQAMTWVLEAFGEGQRAEIIGDSQLVIRQLAGEWRIRAGMYSEKAREAKEIANCGNFKFRWVRRDLNVEADEMTERAYLNEVQS